MEDPRRRPLFTSLAQPFAAQLRPLSDRRQDLAQLARQQRALRMVFNTVLRLRTRGRRRLPN